MLVGLGTTAPTYAVGSRIEKPHTAFAARHFFPPSLLLSKMNSIADTKNNLRKQVLAKRNALPETDRIHMSLSAASQGLMLKDFDPEVFQPGTIVSGFLPIRSEIDARPLMFELMSLGARLCLPVVISKTEIEFREMVRGAPLVESGFGTVGPDEDAEILQPEILLMPLSAFDQKGGRMGYGAGFYDRAVARLENTSSRLRLFGLAFSVQEVDAVPMEPHDRFLDGIITERDHRLF